VLIPTNQLPALRQEERHGPPLEAHPPQCQYLTLSFEVGETEGLLSSFLHARGRGKALPITHLAGEVLHCKDSRQGHHHKLVICNGHACPLWLFLGILQHVDILGDAFRLHLVGVHFCAEGDHINGVEFPAVCVKKGNDVQGCHLSVERP
jgi:hypothetical protein